ncbi:MAG: zinc ribbon domain-containing protein [Desulfobacteraceae bacterium]|nr:zinc ribbon domain-containing protein [Desulfobacteraceae bacterium]
MPVIAERKGAFRCPRCGEITSGVMNSCPQCGQKLNIECPACGQIWRHIHEYIFCPNCGKRGN